MLADRVGFRVACVACDSTDFQFWGSEQYLKDIPLRDVNSYAENPEKSIFSEEEILSFKLMSIELNKNNDGDQACFCLYKFMI